MMHVNRQLYTGKQRQETGKGLVEIRAVKRWIRAQ